MFDVVFVYVFYLISYLLKLYKFIVYMGYIIYIMNYYVVILIKNLELFEFLNKRVIEFKL